MNDTSKEPGIYVISHLDLPAAVSDIQVSDDPGRYAIELSGADGKTITQVDVSNPEKPSVVRQVQLPPGLQHSSTKSRFGNAALFATEDPPSELRPQLITLVSFSNPTEPKAIKQFPGVTAILTDRARELIYMTDASGLWILQFYTTADKRAAEQFDEMLRGSGSGG